MVPLFILLLFFRFPCWSLDTRITHRTITKVSEKFERTIQKRTKLYRLVTPKSAKKLQVKQNVQVVHLQEIQAF